VVLGNFSLRGRKISGDRTGSSCKRIPKKKKKSEHQKERSKIPGEGQSERREGGSKDGKTPSNGESRRRRGGVAVQDRDLVLTRGKSVQSTFRDQLKRVATCNQVIGPKNRKKTRRNRKKSLKKGPGSKGLGEGTPKRGI